MKNYLLLALFVLTIPAVIFSQTLQVGTGLPPNPTSGNAEWGTNVLVLNYEPIGPMAGITTPNGKIWIVINDTLSTTTGGLILRTSTNNGGTWATHANFITNRINFPRLEMTATSNDSVFVWLLFGNQVFRWNVNTNAIKGFDSTTVNDFDIVKSSTNAHYLWITTLSGGLRRFATTDNGYTWGNTGYVQANSINPRMCMSATSDTLFCVYRSPITTPVQNSIIRLARYRESTPGTLSIIDFKDMTDATAFKNEYNIVVANSVAWFYYTTGATGAININCATSINNGTTFGTPFPVAGNPNTDEYYFDVGISGTSTRYCDFIYYSDSLQSGNPTNNTDKLMYAYATQGTPGTFLELTQISQFYPTWSPKNYKPIIVELGGIDVAGVWVGGSAAGYKVYWNRYSLVSRIHNKNTGVPETYKLEQNYPNPFNPVTKIDFSIPKQGFVNLRVYDLLGREVEVLVSKEMSAGNYTFNYNASSLSSGTYFYKLDVNGFTEIKKMTLVK
jgi:hypothetical protein